MPITESPTLTIEGHYHDVLRDARGRVVWDRGWRKNAINVSCRQLLASFIKGTPSALGIDGLLIGAGSDTWDLTAPPTPTPTSSIVDLHPTKIDKVDLVFDFLDGGTVVSYPTNRVQIFASLGPGVPAWPDGDHITSSLREFGLVGILDGTQVLLNYVTHPVITKDPASTLERTIWLVF